MRQRRCRFVLALAILASVVAGAVAQVPPPPPPPPPPPQTTVTITYTVGSSRLSNIAKARLDEAALMMKQDPFLRATVTGYAAVGESPDGDQRLSDLRAKAPKLYLVTRYGIDPARFTVQGRGSSEATGDAEKDRRAVIVLAEP